VSRPWPGKLITRFTAGMLVLADRNFYSYQAWQQGVARGAALLWRVSANLQLPVLQWLPDGSYRSMLINPTVRGRRREQLLAAAAAGHELDPAQPMVVRVIEYVIDNRIGGGELFCLITTLTDHDFAPAVELAAAYAQRWEIELSFDEIEIHQTGGDRVLRSRTPELVKQEIWALLLTHYAIRHVMKDAADTVGTDPDDLSFIRSYRAVRRQVPNQAGFSP
jgi:DDE family transposase